jgi:hypothetical protein
MRKLFALLFVVTTLAFAACQQNTETTSEAADTASVPQEVPTEDPGVEPIAPDTLSSDTSVVE